MLDKFKENLKLKNRKKIFTTIIYYKTIKTIVMINIKPLFLIEV